MRWSFKSRKEKIIKLLGEGFSGIQVFSGIEDKCSEIVLWIWYLTDRDFFVGKWHAQVFIFSWSSLTSGVLTYASKSCEWCAIWHTAQIELHSQNCVFTAVACITLDSKCTGFIIPWLIKMTPLSVPKFYNGLVQVMFHVLHPCGCVSHWLPSWCFWSADSFKLKGTLGSL